MSAAVLRYRKLIATDLTNQAINLAESGTMGHRVQIPMSVDDLNSMFVWYRPSGSDRAVGHFLGTTANGLKFDDIMLNSLSRVYTDIDGVTNGLNYSSSILDANLDSRIRLDGNVSANDIVMAYLLYKCYGTSAAPTMSVVYNLEDAQNMLSNGVLTLAIHNSFSAEEALSSRPGVDKGSIDAMFRDLLATDPMRFFDANGKQYPGLFETNADHDSMGNWHFLENDKIEMRIQFTFTNSVTRRGVQDPSQAISSAANTDDTESVVIAAGSKFIVRLQIVATDTDSGAATKANAQASAIADALVAQLAAAQRAVTNANLANSAALQAVNAAAAQKAAANARYAKCVNDNAAQAVAVERATAAAKAAQDSLDQAIITGCTQSEIQNQRAAAVAANASLQNIKAICDLAAADLQNAKNAQDAAEASLAAAQTAAATCAANVASANAAAAAAEKAAANDAATKAAAQKAAADAASDPATKVLTDAEKKILDPQTLVDAQAAMNAKTSARVAAKSASDVQQGLAELAAAKAANTTKALSDAIASGQTLESIQILRAAAMAAASASASATALSSANLQQYLDAARAELAAQQICAKTSSDACVLRESIANADVNAKERFRASADASNTVAQNANTAAQATAVSAQVALDEAISSGAVLVEVQTKRAAVLDAKSAAAITKVAADNAAAALARAVTAKAAAVAAAAKADTDRLADIALSLNQANLIAAALNESTTYQNSRLYLASANARAQAFNNAQMAKNDAKQNLDVASAAYIIARDALDTAVNGGGTIPEIVALRTASQAAADKQVQAQSIYNAAALTYSNAQSALKKGLVLDASGNPTFDASGNLVLNNNTIWDASANALLIQAATLNLASITNAQANTLVLAYINAQNLADNAAADNVKAANAAEVANKALQSAITGGKTLPEILALRAAAVDAQNAMAAAQAKATNLAAAALGALGKIFTPGPSYAAAVSILNSMRILQTQANNQIRNNAMAAALNAAYVNDTNAQKAFVTAEYAQYVDEKALNDALVGGKSVSEIQHLQNIATAAAKFTADCKQTATFTAAQLAQQLAWSELNFSIDDAGDDISSNYVADASGVHILEQSLASHNAAAESARCNALVRQYMVLLAAADAAATATYKGEAEVEKATSALNTAITQGRTLSELQTLRAAVQAATNIVANLQAAQNLAEAARDSSLASLMARDPSGNYINAGAVQILTDSSSAQVSAIDLAAANQQVNDYVAAFAFYQHSLSDYQAAVSVSLVAAKNLDTAITSGATVSQIQDLRMVLQNARAVEATLLAAKDAANTAQNAKYLAIVNGDRDSSGNLLPRAQIALNILIDAQLRQQRAIAGAETNARARIYYKAMEDVAAANVALVAAQNAYDLAANLLNQAITAGADLSEIQNLRAASQAAGDVVSAAQANASLARAAADVAHEAVMADPNAQAILDAIQLYQANMASFAKANRLLDAANAANDAVADAQHTYNLAKVAADISAAALDTGIANGVPISEIQRLRDVSVAAAKAVTDALIALNLKKAAALQARTDASVDPLATVILDASEQFNLIATASANVNAALITLNQAQAAAILANNKSVIDKNLADAAATALRLAVLPYDVEGDGVTSSPQGGKTQQEIVELRAAASSTAATAAQSKAAYDSAAALVVRRNSEKLAADAVLAAVPWPQLDSIQAYTMTTVSLNETKVSETDVSGAAAHCIYIDSRVLKNAKTGMAVGEITYAPLDLSGVQILGLGVSETTKIVSYKVVASMPKSLYPTAVEIKLNKAVTVGDGVFYMVGGELLLRDFIM